MLPTRPLVLMHEASVARASASFIAKPRLATVVTTAGHERLLGPRLSQTYPGATTVLSYKLDSCGMKSAQNLRRRFGSPPQYVV